MPIYTPCREQSTQVLCFSLAEGERAWWCSSYAHKVFDGMPEPHYLSFLLSKLHFSQYLSRFSGPSCYVPVFTAVDRPRRSRRRHHRGEPLDLIFCLKEKSSYLYDLDRYLCNFLTYYCLLLYSAMVLVSASVGPRPVYDSDLVRILSL